MRLPNWNRHTRAPTDELLDVCGVPASKWQVSLDAIAPDAPHLAPVRSYQASLRLNLETGRGLLLHGDYRVGKSSIAACILAEVARHRLRPVWLEAFELVDGWINADDRYDDFRSAPFIVLDDLGTEGDSEFRKDVILRALRFRLEREGATVITTNLSPSGLGGRYGPKALALLRDYLAVVLVQPGFVPSPRGGSTDA